MTTFKFLKSRPFAKKREKSKCRIFQMPTGFAVGICVVVQHFTVIAKKVAEIWWFDLIWFLIPSTRKNPRWRTAAILDSCACVLGITHEEYLAIFTVVQNLIVMGSVVFKVSELQCYANLTWKCLFRPLLGSFERKVGETETFCSFSLYRNANNRLASFRRYRWFCIANAIFVRSIFKECKNRFCSLVSGWTKIGGHKKEN